MVIIITVIKNINSKEMENIAVLKQRVEDAKKQGRVPENLVPENLC